MNKAIEPFEPISLEKCSWCNGSGRDGEYGMYPCFDCEETGFKEGKKAERYNDYLIEKEEQELIKKGLL